MKALSLALLARFKATPNNFYTITSGQLFKEVARSTATKPYAVFHIISNTPDFTFTSDYEKTRIQFDLYSDKHDSSEIEDMYTYLKELYDWCSLSVSGNLFVYMKRLSARLGKDVEEDVWFYHVDYEVFIEHIAGVSPSNSPSASPSQSPSTSPSASPSTSPSKSPSVSPSASPSVAP